MLATNRPRYKLGGANSTGHRRHRPDHTLLLLVGAFLVVGLIVVYSISPGLAAQKRVSEGYFVVRQLLAIILGLAVFALTAQLSPWKLAGWRRLLVAAAVLATVAALVLPVSAEYPAHRWIKIGGLSLQSVELIKFALVVCLAAFLHRRAGQDQLLDGRQTTRPVIVTLGLLGLVVAGAQRDLGSAAVLGITVIAMLYVAGIPLKRLILVGAVIAIGAGLAIAASAYRQQRIFTFLHPEKDCLASGYQACQALISIGSGGLFGRGLSRGVQAYGYLPEAANDSIFAVLGEKFGFFGLALLIFSLIFFYSRLFRICERAPDLFSRLIVAGVLAWFSSQTFINVGAMVGLLPLKGITLPFISYGGTSIIFSLAAAGLAFNVSRYTVLGGAGALTGNKTAKRGENAKRQSFSIHRP